MAELDASNANTKYWLQTQNTMRTIGESCGEKIWFTLNVLHYQRQPTHIKACMNTDRICLARPLLTLYNFDIQVVFRLTLQRGQMRGSLRRRLGGERNILLPLGRREEELDRGRGLLS